MKSGCFVYPWKPNTKMLAKSAIGRMLDGSQDNMEHIGDDGLMKRIIVVSYVMLWIGGLLMYGAVARQALAGNDREQGAATGKLIFDQELVIGEDETTPPLGHIIGACVDSKYNLYILDLSAVTIYKYAENGDYLQSIGREGEGPGELTRPLSVAIGPADNIYVAGGSSKITIFKPDGSYKGDFRHNFPDAPVRSMVVDSQGNIYICCVDIPNQTVVHEYSPAGKRLASFCPTYAVGHDIDTRIERYYSGGYIARDQKDRLYFAQLAPFTVRIFDDEHRELMSIQPRQNESPPPPEPVVDANGGIRFTLPSTATAIVSMPDNRFLTSFMTQPKHDKGEKRTVYLDLYALNGSRVASRVFDHWISPVCADRRGRIYTRETKNVPVVVRYAVQVE